MNFSRFVCNDGFAKALRLDEVGVDASKKFKKEFEAHRILSSICQQEVVPAGKSSFVLDTDGTLIYVCLAIAFLNGNLPFVRLCCPIEN